MVIFNLSTFVRNWFSRRTSGTNVPRKSIRRRQGQSIRSVALERLEERLVLSAIVVTSAGDTIAVDGFVTLREAIASLNNGADINGDVAAAGAYGNNDTISFDISGVGVQTISPLSPLPTIVKPVILDGYTQAGTSVNTLATADNAVLLIELSGSGAGLETNGLILGVGSNGSSISGLVINSFGGAGILVQSDGNTISGNFLGTDVAGLTGVTTTGTFGVAIDGSFRNVIGGTALSARNIIGGNSDGINLSTGSQNTLIQGNFIGVGADGTTLVGNRLHGVVLQGDGGLGIQNNQIGGTVAGAGNMIANNGAAGVAIFGSVLSTRQNSGNTILGNSIFNNGLNSPGTIPGIDLSAGAIYPNDDGITLNDFGDLDIGPNQLQDYPVLTSALSDLVSTTILGTLNSAPNTTYRIEFFSNPTLGAAILQGQTYLGFVNVTTDPTGLAIINTTLSTSVPSGQFITSTATSGGAAAGTTQTGIHPNILGSAANFAILAGSTVTTTGQTSLVGDLGISPGAALDGTLQTTGTLHIADPIASQAQTDLTDAYNTLAAQTGAIDLTGFDLGTMVLVPGVYRFDSSAQLTGTLTLDTQGDPHATFVFQIVSTLTTAVNSSIVVLGSSDSIFWQVGSSATIGVGSQFVGNIVAFTSITVGTGASLTSGRALARNGAVTLDSVFADSTTPPENNTSEFSAAVQILIPEISIDDVTIVEGNGGTSTAVFTVTLSAASGQTVTVVATSSLGTAGVPGDYLAFLPTTLTFAPGETTQTVSVTIISDLIAEPNETFFIDLTAPVNATIADSQGMGTITNDDNILVSVSTITNGAESIAPTAGVIRVSQTIVSLTDTVVNYSISGSATAGNDYTALSGTVTILAGQTSADINVAVLNDLLAEGTETVTVTLTALGAHGPLIVLDTVPANLTATANIIDDDILAITTGATLNPPENTLTSTVIADVDTNSAPGTILVYSLTGPDAAAFNIDAATGEITFVASPDYELPIDVGNDNIYNVTVQVTADFVLDQFASQDLVITVAPLNDNTPVITSVTTAATVASGTSSSTVIFDINATDADLPAQTLTYSLSGPDSSLFAINSTTGEITFLASPDLAVPLDQGADNVYNVTVTVTDDVESLLSSSQALTITVVPLNQIAPVITSGATATVPENTLTSTVVIDVNATDASVPTQTLTYSLSGPDALVFAIDSNTGEIRFLVSPDFELPTDVGLDNVYLVTVTVTDNGAPILSATQDLTITVTAVDELPPIFVDASPTFSIPENSPVGTFVGGVTATDSDLPAVTLTYSIVGGNEAGAFTINPMTGVITVANSSPLDFEVIQQFTLQVRVTNDASPTPMSTDATVVVNITDVAEGAIITIPVPVGLFHLGRIPAFVSPVATFTYADVATPNYAGAQLTTSIVVNRGRRDKLDIFPKGNGNDQINVKGRKVYFGGVQIGTFTGGKGSRNPDLVVTFNANATTGAIDGLVRRLNFFVKDNVGSTRTVHVQLTNIGGVNSNIATRDIQVTDQQDATL